MDLRTAWRLAIGATWVVAALAGVPSVVHAAEDAASALSATDGDESSRRPIMFDARIVGDDSRVRFVADLSSTVDVAVFTLADPYRIIVDMPDVRFALPALAGTEARGFASAFRYGSISTGKTRVVIDVTTPVNIEETFAIEPAAGQPARLVIDVVPSTREEFRLGKLPQRRERGSTGAPPL